MFPDPPYIQNLRMTISNKLKVEWWLPETEVVVEKEWSMDTKLHVDKRKMLWSMAVQQNNYK